MNDALDPRLLPALANVVDPEMGLDIVALGLIYEATLSEDGEARILMTTTTRGCPLVGALRDAVIAGVFEIEEVASVEVALTYNPPWTPARIAADHAGVRRSGTDTTRSWRSRLQDLFTRG